MTTEPALIGATELARLLGDPGVKIVDARFKMPGVTPTAAEDYRAGHIPGAVFFDIDRIAAPETPLPHMLPSPTEFAGAVAALGISNTDRVVLYDAAGIAGAARAWWTFRVFGHERVAILDGGLKSWQRLGYATDADPVEPIAGHYAARFDPRLVRSSAEIMENLTSRREQVIDARAAGRFVGRDEEPWPGRRSGHIPGSLNLDHNSLLDPETGLVKPPAALERAFIDAGIRTDEPIVTTCGSGVTACVLAFGLHLIGHDAAVFDGSWAEWGLDHRFPIETGPAKIS